MGLTFIHHAHTGWHADTHTLAVSHSVRMIIQWDKTDVRAERKRKEMVVMFHFRVCSSDAREEPCIHREGDGRRTTTAYRPAHVVVY